MPRFALHALPVMLLAVLGVLIVTAWWKNGPDRSNAYSAVGAGLIGLVINPHEKDGQQEKWANLFWQVLIVLGMVTCVATAIAMFVHGSDHKNAGVAFVTGTSEAWRSTR